MRPCPCLLGLSRALDLRRNNIQAVQEEPDLTRLYSYHLGSGGTKRYWRPGLLSPLWILPTPFLAQSHYCSFRCELTGQGSKWRQDLACEES